MSAKSNNVAPWALGPKAGCRGIMPQLQPALDVVQAKLASIALQLSANKMEAMLEHPSPRRAKCLHIDGEKLSWNTSVRPPGDPTEPLRHLPSC